MSFLMPCEIKYNKNGIKQKDAARLRAKYGANTFTKKPRKTFLSQYLSAFGDPIIKILLIALGLNVIIAMQSADIYEPLGIAVALFLATFVSTLSEYGSESAFLKLEKQSSDMMCKVIRDGKVRSVNVCELVVFDTVCLSGGDRVPADGVIAGGSVRVDESSLNGESRGVRKYADALGKEWDISSCGQLFRGSVITEGECIMTVGRTGDNTLYGSVASELQESATKSPLTERLTVLAGVLAKIGYCAAALVFFADLFNSLVMDNAFNTRSIIAELGSLSQMITNLLHALTLAITVVVVAVPEGLPMMITVVLSSNMKRLKNDNVLVRRLVGIETGGSINILFTDKTGTLTKGSLSVSAFYDDNGEYYKTPPRPIMTDVARCLVLSNDAEIIDKKATFGNATDRALLQYAYPMRVPMPKISDKIPFDSSKKYAAAKADGVWYIKGAPEIVLSKCKDVSEGIYDCLQKLTKQGSRVIALAISKDMQNYTLVGLVAICDTLRKDARFSVKTVQNAGVHVCMVTGDNKETAKAVAASCGIMIKDGIILTSEQMSQMTDSELAAVLPKLCVVARALPSDKSRLVRLAKNSGYVCAMTGDGINDAPALKMADVGYAMGSGTEVAKQAGDIVILDDSFFSVSKSILYGRTIFKSIRKFIVFQLTMNLCAVGISVIGPFIGVDTPVTVMQMLWINIIMDTLAGLAFAGEPPIERYMKEKPVHRNEKVLNGEMTLSIFSMGIYNLSMCCIFLMSELFKNRYGFYTHPLRFMTAFFALFVFSGVFGAFNARSAGMNIFSNLSKNTGFIVIFMLIFAVQIWLIYFGGPMFRTLPIPIFDLLEIIALSSSVIPFNMVCKAIFKCLKKH